MVLLVVADGEAVVGIEVVNTFAIGLVSQTLGNVAMRSAYQFVDHCLKYHIEAFGQDVLLGASVDSDAVGVLKEGIAQIPKLQSFVGKILVFDLHQTGLAHAIHILAELLAADQVVLNVDGRVKSIFFV